MARSAASRTRVPPAPLSDPDAAAYANAAAFLSGPIAAPRPPARAGEPAAVTLLCPTVGCPETWACELTQHCPQSVDCTPSHDCSPSAWCEPATSPPDCVVSQEISCPTVGCHQTIRGCPPTLPACPVSKDCITNGCPPPWTETC